MVKIPLAPWPSRVYTCAMNYLNLTQTDQLVGFCQQLENQAEEKHQAWLAIDTEFVRQDTYYPLLSLVQICTQDGQLALIDPLAIEDLSSLWQLLANPKLTKVFHSARQDIEVLYQVGGLMPQNLFDTQIASVFLGHGDMAGFARVIEAEFNTTLDKAQTRTNWHQRPLTEQQIQYALDDVRYLAPLYQKLQERLSNEQKAALNSDFEQLLNPSLYRIDPNQAWLKVKSTKNFSKKQLGLVKALAAWREETAIALNQPRKWIISDEAIISLAKRPVSTQEGLYKVPELNAGLVRQFGAAIIEQLDLAFAHPENWPEKPQTAPAATEQEDILRQLATSLAHQVAANFGINLNNLIDKPSILALIRQQPSQLDHGWRSLLLGEPLKQLLKQQACLVIQNTEVTIKPR